MSWKGNGSSCAAGSKEAWGVLTDDEIDQIGGKRDRLVGLLQERLGYTRMQADREIDRLLDDLDRSA